VGFVRGYRGGQGRCARIDVVAPVIGEGDRAGVGEVGGQTGAQRAATDGEGVSPGIWGLYRHTGCGMYTGLYRCYV
jgi:hypothetical protein